MFLACCCVLKNPYTSYKIYVQMNLKSEQVFKQMMRNFIQYMLIV